MNLKLNDTYRILYDGMGYILYKTVPVKHKDGTPDTKEVIEGFYGTLTQLLQGLHRHDIQGAPVTTVSELRDREDVWVKQMCALLKEMYEQDN